MGASSSTLKRLVEEEFTRLSQGRPHIVLDEILEFRLSSGGWVVRTDCIGLLYSVDKCVRSLHLCTCRVNRPRTNQSDAALRLSIFCRDRDGRFQLSELKQFVSDWNYLGKNITHHELQGNIHSVCMAQFWKEIHTDEGMAGAIEW
jgi:hypothetical protein